MIAGLPAGSWVLLLAAVGLGLGLEILYLWAHCRRAGSGRTRDGAQGPPGDPLEPVAR